jgi:hypothetical protein
VFNTTLRKAVPANIAIAKMLRQYFDPVVDRIVDLVTEQVREVQKEHKVKVRGSLTGVSFHLTYSC